MTVEKLKQVFTTASDGRLFDFNEVWHEYANDFGVNTVEQENMILATLLSEVGSGLENKRENLNYTPESLRATFSRYKNNPNWSERDGRNNAHAANQINIGNIAYADRLGNGDISSGDGYRYRGGSYIQTTGSYNWSESARVISMLTSQAIDSEYLERTCSTVQTGLLMTFAFWFDNDIASCDTMDCCTSIVNKHTSSRQKRNDDYNRISKL